MNAVTDNCMDANAQPQLCCSPQKGQAAAPCIACRASEAPDRLCRNCLNLDLTREQHDKHAGVSAGNMPGPVMLCRGSWRMLKAGCRRCTTPTPASSRSKRSAGDGAVLNAIQAAQLNAQACGRGMRKMLTGIHAWPLLHPQGCHRCQPGLRHALACCGYFRETPAGLLGTCPP